MSSSLRLLFSAASAFAALGLWAGEAWAAPCCAGNGAAPALITGDEQAQLSFAIAYGAVIGDAPTEGIPVFRASSDSEATYTQRVEGAVLLSDRWQAGVVAPLVHRRVDRGGLSAADTRLGDMQLNLAYEFLPEWVYSPWKPKGYGYLQLTAPAGRSIHESEAAAAVDATGNGFWTVALGAALIKRWSRWDALLIPEIRYSLPRSFDSSEGAIEHRPGWGGALAAGGGYSLGNWRVGFRVQPVYSQPAEVRSDASGTAITAHKLSWNTGLDATWLLSDDWSASASYLDQTLIGPVSNTTLSRSVALSIQRRWSR